MKATCIEFSETRAVVRMEPNWLARLFGARVTVIAFGRAKRPGDHPNTIFYTPWVCPGSGRGLDDLDYEVRELITDALDFREVADLPIARARTA